MYQKGNVTVKELAALYDICEATVYDILPQSRITKPMKLSDLQQTELYELRNRGMSVPDLMKKFNVSHSTIYYILNKKGYKFPQEHPHRKLTDADIKNIIQGYKNGQLITNLAKEYNISAQALYHHLDKYNLRKPEQISQRHEKDTLLIAQNETGYLLSLPSKPSPNHRAGIGTRVLALDTQKTYVQISRDETKIEWVELPSKKGLWQKIKGLFAS